MSRQRRTPRGGNKWQPGLSRNERRMYEQRIIGPAPTRLVRVLCAACEQRRQDRLDNRYSPPTEGNREQVVHVDRYGPSLGKREPCPDCEGQNATPVMQSDSMLEPLTEEEEAA